MGRFPIWLAVVALGCGSDLTQPDPPPRPVTAVRLGDVEGNYFVPFDRFTLFVGYETLRGSELWRTDGTPSGTAIVKDIDPGASSSAPFWMTRHGSVLFFAASDREHGNELWRSDGTEAGTVLVHDINPGPQLSAPHRGDGFPGEIVSAGDFVAFRACDEEHGPELWRSDGTPQGTRLVADIFPGPGRSTRISNGVCLSPDLGPRDLTVVDGIVYFFALHPSFGTELWRSDGTAAGTWMVTEVHPGPDPPPVMRNSGIPVADLVSAGGRLFFRGPDGLWTSDGSADGTRLLGPSLAVLLTGARSRVYFVGPGAPTALWTSDGTPQGTRVVQPVDVATDVRFDGHISPRFAFGDILFFEGCDAVAACEPWRSDATSPGTIRLGDLDPGPDSSFPDHFVAVGGDVYFAAHVGDRDWRLFRAPPTGGPATSASAATWSVEPELGSLGRTVLVSAGGLWAVDTIAIAAR